MDFTQPISTKNIPLSAQDSTSVKDDEESTDFKIATLSSLLPNLDQGTLLEALVASGGSVEKACDLSIQQRASHSTILGKRKLSSGMSARQGSLSFSTRSHQAGEREIHRGVSRQLPRKGRTLHLFSPEDISRQTPCTIIHDFLPSSEATTLLQELLSEASSFQRQTFKVFDNVVQSPHSSCFYVPTLPEAEAQKKEWIYNGASLEDVREATPEMRKVSAAVKKAVNKEIAERIRQHYPRGQKLKYQSSKEWEPNAAFVNCYDGGGESVGYHSDQLTYLGPRAVIGSLSLGVTREFRVRKVVARQSKESNAIHGSPDSPKTVQEKQRADEEGQISIHLPHNSLLVMHAEMQEEWKHSITPSRSITPHPIAGNKRINITYRWYREEFHPKHTPMCHCRVPCVLRCVQKKAQTRGMYMWQCHAGLTDEEGKKNCNFFEWAAFTDDGKPIWKK